MHTHKIVNGPNGTKKVVCPSTPPCKAAQSTQKTLNAGAKEDRKKRKPGDPVRRSN